MKGGERDGRGTTAVQYLILFKYCKRAFSFTQWEPWEADRCDNPVSSRWRCFNDCVKQNCTFSIFGSLFIISKWDDWSPVGKKMVLPVLIQSGPEERMMVHWQEREKRGILSFFLLSISNLFFPSVSDWAVRCEEEEEEEAGLFSSSPTTSELPAGSELFYALVVTGRFIRLEICTNQLSFSGSCQCVKLSGPAVREMP